MLDDNADRSQEALQAAKELLEREDLANDEQVEQVYLPGFELFLVLF